jgi:hypothetical protein
MRGKGRSCECRQERNLPTNITASRNSSENSRVRVTKHFYQD